MTECIQVQTTVGSEAEAEQLSTALVERRLAACVQVVGPISSRYRWRGEVEREREWLCLIKTARPRYAALEEAIRELHAYDEPEILAVPVAAGGEGYLRWIADSVG